MSLSTLYIIWPINMQNLKVLRPTVEKGTHSQEKKLFNIDLWVKVTQNIAQYPLYSVTYAPAKFEFATSNGLG